VTGPPASGKTSLSRALASALGLPLLAKDDLKQRLLDADPVPDVEASRQLGRLAVDRLLAAAREQGEAVLDSVWVDRPRAVERLGALGDVVEVFCRCDLPTLRARYAERAPTKGAGHFDEERTDDELWPPAALEPLAGGWPVVDVDTARPVDVAAVARAVRGSRP
jgi:predicted kinase